MDCSARLRDVHLGVYATAFLLGCTVGKNLYVAYLDDAVAGYACAGGLKIEEHQRSGQIKFHDHALCQMTCIGI